MSTSMSDRKDNCCLISFIHSVVARFQSNDAWPHRSESQLTLQLLHSSGFAMCVSLRMPLPFRIAVSDVAIIE